MERTLPGPSKRAREPMNEQSGRMAHCRMVAGGFVRNQGEITIRQPQEARWGSITKMWLPCGGEVGLYQPKHPTALGLK
jgi:hypothetical protein